jgi:DNA-binding IclR family transcriptional regulator
MLAREYFTGLSNKDLAKSLKTSAANVSRDLGHLADLGYAHKLDNGRWSLTTKPLAIYQAFTNHFNDLDVRMKESVRNINAAAMRQE